MKGRFEHANHVVRMAGVFLAGTVLFLIIRAALIPDDFGTLGFYRAGALDEIRALPIAYAGRPACEDCHSGTYLSLFEDAVETAEADPKKDNGHSVLRCEACHGPLAFHAVDKKAEDEGKKGSGRKVPVVTNDKLCLGCHREIAGRPAFQPQVIPVDHGASDACETCHRPHRPRTDEDEE
jgi:hypothetical protein